MYVIYSGMEERLCRMPESKLLNQSINHEQGCGICHHLASKSAKCMLNIKGLTTFGSQQGTIVLDDEQNEEMCLVMEAIQSEEIDKVFKEGEEHGVGDIMKS